MGARATTPPCSTAHGSSWWPPSSRARVASRLGRRWPSALSSSHSSRRSASQACHGRRCAPSGSTVRGRRALDGVISSKGSTNFSQAAWRGFDFRGALELRLGIPVIYNNDGNAAALYAHHVHFGHEAAQRSSVSAIVGTGLGGGVIEAGRVIRGAAGMAGELGHVYIPMQGLLAEGQPVPECNCGFFADAESVASLTGIERNLLPFWLTRFPDHELAKLPSIGKAARMVRDFGDAQDPMALAIFVQQAMALGRLFTIASNFVDPDAYFVGGGVVEASARFRQWFLDQVREHTSLRRSSSRWRRSPSSPIWTWPEPAVRHSRPLTSSERSDRPPPKQNWRSSAPLGLSDSYFACQGEERLGDRSGSLPDRRDRHERRCVVTD